MRPADRHRRGGRLVSVVSEATPPLGWGCRPPEPGGHHGTARWADTSHRWQARRRGWEEGAEEALVSLRHGEGPLCLLQESGRCVPWKPGEARPSVFRAARRRDDANEPRATGRKGNNKMWCFKHISTVQPQAQGPRAPHGCSLGCDSPREARDRRTHTARPAYVNVNRSPTRAEKHTC